MESYPQAREAKYSFSEHIGFIENKGQLHDQFQKKNSEVRYLLHANGMNVQLKSNSFSYDTYKILHSSPITSRHDLTNDRVKKTDSTIYNFHRVDIRFIGANPSPEIIAEDQSKNYFVYYSPGNREGNKVYHFRRVLYREIYPGIDVVFDTRNVQGQKGFEYYFIIKPGADVNSIKIQYNGAKTSLQDNKVIIHTAGGEIEESIPASFLTNTSNPDLSQLPEESLIKVVYKEHSKGIYQFVVPAYDKTKTLIIDPTPDLVWGTYYGGNLNDWAYSIDRDPGGNILVGGGSDNPNMATAGAYQTVFAGNSDAMFGKFASNGSLLWMTYFGGEWADFVNGICSDNNGNIFVTGYTDSKTGVATAGSFQTTHGDAAFGRDGFLAKFNSSGSRIWSTYYGGSDADYLHAVRADANGNIFIAGWTFSTNGISSPGSYQTAYASSTVPQDWGDGFLARFDNNGNRIWGTYYGGVSFDRFYDMTLDNNGNVYASGITRSNGLSSTGAFQPNFGGGFNDALIVKFDNNGNRLWATYYGGNNEDYSEAITCDNQNNIIVGGMTISTSAIATAGTYLPVFAGGTRDGFVVKFSESGNRVWGTYYGGEGEEMVYGLTCDASNNIIVTGSTYSTTNIATANSYLPTFPATGFVWTPFIAKLNGAGNRLWGTYYGYGSPFWNGDALDAVTDNSGNVFVCGVTLAPNGIATCNAVQPTWSLNQDMFVAMFSETIIAATLSVTISSNTTTTICAGMPITFTAVPINGGTNPAFQWKVNGINAGTNNPDFTTSSLNNGDMVSCTVTSNSTCITAPTATSNVITVSISSPITPSVSIISSATGVVCAGMAITFTAVPINGGTNPAFQWKVNGINAGANNPVFTTSNLTNGDLVTCVVTSNSTCTTTPTVTSNVITISISPSVIPSVNIISSATGPICAGSPVTFTATPSNGGSAPVFQWKINGNNTGTNNPVFTTTTLVNGDAVSCVLTNQFSCNAITTATSNSITLIVASMVTPSIAIIASTTTVCAGTPITFTATPINGGINPAFQWKVNGINAGANNPVFTTSNLNNGDMVSCTVTSNATCLTAPTANSNVIVVSIRSSVIPSVSITSSASGPICVGSPVTFTAAPSNGGSNPIFQWKINGNNTGTNSPLFTTSILVNGDVVTCELTNQFSCNPVTTAVSNLIAITVTSTITPSITITASSTAVCAGTPITLTASVSNAGNNPGYQWKVNGVTVGSSSNYTSSSLSNNDAVQCFLSPDNTGCISSTNIASNTIGVQIYSLPNFTIQPGNVTISNGDTLQLTVIGTNISTYKWTPVQNINNSTNSNPMVWPDHTVTYTLEATSADGCVRSKQVTVNVISGIFIPTAFTPNNDGLNDRWGISGLEIYPDCQVTVFNRWGQIVFQSSGYARPWDGSLKGQKFPTSSFVYLIDLKNGKKPLSGTVTIIR